MSRRHVGDETQIRRLEQGHAVATVVGDQDALAVEARRLGTVQHGCRIRDDRCHHVAGARLDHGDRIVAKFGTQMLAPSNTANWAIRSDRHGLKDRPGGIELKQLSRPVRRLPRCAHRQTQCHRIGEPGADVWSPYKASTQDRDDRHRAARTVGRPEVGAIKGHAQRLVAKAAGGHGDRARWPVGSIT